LSARLEGATEVAFAHGDGELPVGQLPDAVPESFPVKLRSDPGAVARRLRRQRHSAAPAYSAADSTIVTRPRKTSNMAAWELGESSEDERSAIGATTSSPTTTEIPPRMAPPKAMREVRR
jgi:hypothetical protein